MAFRRVPIIYTPPPAEVLTKMELQALYDWRQCWGAITYTRVPFGEATFARFWPDRVPLIEVAGRATYRRLCFAAWLHAHGRLH